MLTDASSGSSGAVDGGYLTDDPSSYPGAAVSDGGGSGDTVTSFRIFRFTWCVQKLLVISLTPCFVVPAVDMILTLINVLFFSQKLFKREVEFFKEKPKTGRIHFGTQTAVVAMLETLEVCFRSTSLKEGLDSF